MNIKTIYICIAILMMAISAHAQDVETVFDEDTVAVDSALMDSIAHDSIAAKTIELPWPQSLVATLDDLVKSDISQTSQIGLMVYDLDADSAIYCHNELQTMRPASTMKVITAIAALDKLGGSYQFKTDLCYTGEIKGHVLHGDIYCVGGFDPKFNVDDLNAFVEGVRRMGIDTIMGNIYADKSMKDTARLGEGWCWDDDNPCLSPLLIGRKDNFIDRFAQKLVDEGVVIIDKDSVNCAFRFMNSHGNFVRRKPQGTYSITSRFHTIEQVMMKMLKESDNLYAESMFYQLAASTGARPATAKNARAVINHLITKIGLNPKRYNIADGSGLSLYNYVSPMLEVMFLRYAYRNENIYPHLLHALPIAGFDGTLKSRMKHTDAFENVRAKTGTVTCVSSLAGYCTAQNGHRLCFSIINQGVIHSSNARHFQDKVCNAMCQ